MSSAIYQEVTQLASQLDTNEQLALMQKLLEWLQDNNSDNLKNKKLKFPTLGQLGELAEKANVSFDDPDLSENTKSFMEIEYVEFIERYNENTDTD